MVLPRFQGVQHMKSLEVAAAMTVFSAAVSVATAGFVVVSATGNISSSVTVNLHGTQTTETDGGPFLTAGPVIELGTSAMSRPTFREAALASGYTVVLTRGSSLVMNGSTEAIANSGSNDSSGHAEAAIELHVRFDVDARSIWRLPSGYAAASGGTSHYTLRRAGDPGSIITSAGLDWTVASGVLTPGSYEFAIKCSSAASVAGGPSDDGLALSASSRGHYQVTLELLDAPTGGPVADFNGDGFVDFTDFDSFVSAFESGDPTADMNLDSFIDFTDFDTFIWVFEN